MNRSQTDMLISSFLDLSEVCTDLLTQDNVFGSDVVTLPFSRRIINFPVEKVETWPVFFRDEKCFCPNPKRKSKFHLSRIRTKIPVL